MALPGARDCPSRFQVRARLGARSRLVWEPEPTVVTERAAHVVDVGIDLARDAALCWRDEVVLGREAERSGRAHLRLHADRDGMPLLRHELDLGVTHDAFPVLGAARACGTALLVAHPFCAPPPVTDVEHGVFAVGTDAALVVALGPASGVRATLDHLGRPAPRYDAVTLRR